MSLDAARRSLEGLALGDAYGQRHFRSMPASVDDLVPGTWCWTDDTHMGLSIVEILERHGRIDQDDLAAALTRRHSEEPMRGYAGGARRLLFALAGGGQWRELAPRLFPGGGSYGNGAAMRIAPLGAFFQGDPGRAANEAALSAVVTHAHPEGQAGAIAVAVAASILRSFPVGRADAFLDACADHVPAGETHDGVALARAIPRGAFEDAARKLGSGLDVSAQDTVPFCLWMVAHEREFAHALWRTVRAGGDCDTTCAIVGGILAAAGVPLPEHWLARREPLPQ